MLPPAAAPVVDVENMADRNSLLKRALIPELRFSDGSRSSLTPPPKPEADQTTLLDIFAVRGYAVVTGGCGGLGLEAARGLLRQGSPGVALLDMDPTAALVAIQQLASDFPSAKVITKKIDVTDADNIAMVMSELRHEFSSLDILLCFAGVVCTEPSLDISSQLFRRTIDVNTTGSFLCAQAVARIMVEQKTGGSILFVASVSGHLVVYPQPQAAYGTSKAAVVHLTRSLAAEWAVHGIRVNSISPGYMDTVLNHGPGMEKLTPTWLSRVPMGRFGQPSELVGTIVMLCSSASSYTTGADIIVDGGLRLL